MVQPLSLLVLVSCPMVKSFFSYSEVIFGRTGQGPYCENLQGILLGRLMVTEVPV